MKSTLQKSLSVLLCAALIFGSVPPPCAAGPIVSAGGAAPAQGWGLALGAFYRSPAAGAALPLAPLSGMDLLAGKGLTLSLPLARALESSGLTPGEFQRLDPVRQRERIAGAAKDAALRLRADNAVLLRLVEAEDADGPELDRRLQEAEGVASLYLPGEETARLAEGRGIVAVRLETRRAERPAAEIGRAALAWGLRQDGLAVLPTASGVAEPAAEKRAGPVRRVLGSVKAAVRSVRGLAVGDPEMKPIVQGYKRQYRLAQALLLVDAGLTVGLSWGLGQLIDTASAGKAVPASLQPLILFSGLILTTSVIYAFVERMHTWVAQRLAARIIRDVRARLFAHIGGLSMEFFRKNPSAQLLPRISEDVTHLVTKNVGVKISMPHYLVAFGASAWMLFAHDWRVAVAVLATMPVFGLLSAYFGGRLEKINELFTNQRSDALGQAGDALSNMEVVKMFGMEEAVAQRFARSVGELADTGVERARVNSWYHALSSSLGDFATKISIFLIGCWALYYLGLPTVGALTAMQAYAFGIKYATNGIGSTWTNYKEAEGGSRRVLEILRTQPEVADAPDAVELGPLTGEVEFRDVGFSYDGKTPVLHGVSFRTTPGQMIAFVGETGSGKSTVLRLLSRLYDPVTGAVLVDGKDLRGVKRASLARQVAVVPQDAALFAGTIRENLKAVKPDATDSEMAAALQAAFARFVFEPEVCPQGLDTVVGERGAKLSGGQKQRLAIARAILRNPHLLLLDEATSALDNESEGLVQEALQRLMKGRTTFVVAHRLTTIRHAHRILVLDKGRIVESGTHEELLAREGRYFHLWNAATRTPTPIDPTSN